MALDTLEIYIRRIAEVTRPQDLETVRGHVWELLKSDLLSQYSIKMITSLVDVDRLAGFNRHADGSLEIYAEKWFREKGRHIILAGPDAEFNLGGKKIEGAGFGAVHLNHAFLKKYEKLAVQHELGHLLGANYPEEAGGNCSTQGCLMEYVPKENTFCKSCADMIASQLEPYREVKILGTEKPTNKSSWPCESP